MTSRSIRWVIGLGILAILAILGAQAYFFYNAFNIKEKESVQSIKVSLQSVAETMSRLNNTILPDDIIHQFSPGYYIVDINNHIDPMVLEHYLKTELVRRHLSLDFEYAIYDCYDDKMVYGNYVSLDERTDQKEKLNSWPKYEEGIYYFGIHFPALRKYILGEMQLWFFFTAILGVVIVFFGYTLMIIFQQKRLSEIQRDFINNMSHEFKTPLTSISLAAEVLGEEGILQDPARLRKYALILKEQIGQMQKKVNSILLQAETEHRSFGLKRQRISLPEMITEVMDEFRSRVEHRNGSLVFDNRAGDVFVMADRFHFAGLLINLIDNSLKYAERQPEVGIVLEELKDHLTLKVADNGTGIGKKDLKRVFDEFYRVPSGNVHNVKGSGLGLAYVRRIIRLHRWKLQVESEPGKGTVMTIIIPKTDGNGR